MENGIYNLQRNDIIGNIRKGIKAVQASRKIVDMEDLNRLLAQYVWPRDVLIWFAARLKPSKDELLISCALIHRLHLQDFVSFMAICIVAVEVMDGRRLSFKDITKVSKGYLSGAQIALIAPAISHSLTYNGPIQAFELVNIQSQIQKSEQLVPHFSQICSKGDANQSNQCVPENE